MRTRSQSGASPLDRLATAYGIAPDYRDAWGKRRPVPRDSKIAILQAMGVAAESAEAVAAGLADAERRAWRRLLPPAVVVAAEAEGPEVPLAAPCEAGRLTWTLTLEEGGALSGSADFAALNLLARATAGGVVCERRGLPLPQNLPAGYHDFTASLAGAEVRSRLIVAPAACHDLAEALPGGRGFGVSAQLYSLRGREDWGIGDFGALADFARQAAAEGAEAVGLSPLHALFPADPAHESPYAPSSRLFLNLLFIDVAALPELADSPETRAQLESAAFLADRRRVAAAELIDYPAIAALKLPLLQQLHRAFRRRHLGSTPSARGEQFLRYFAGTPYLREQALFDALQERFFKREPGLWDWRRWPEPYRRPTAAGSLAFASEAVERIGFFAWLQWVAELQLAKAQREACAAGMAVGLYRDLAVAVHPGGAMTWSEPEVFAGGASVGAPPDAFNPCGQNWGLAALSPAALSEQAYAPFISVLRANMRHAGALRIDHVMALARLFWIPEGGSPADGAYVAYPAQDLLRIVALESRRHGCAVIGEDLGTLPEGFRERLQECGILSSRLLWFEREEGGGFKPPETYPVAAQVAASTHDLPTVSGWWHGRDLDWRERLGLLGAEAPEAARVERLRERALLLARLRAEGLLPAGPGPGPAALAVAIHRLLARSPAKLLMLQAEDLLGVEEQANLPGTFREHPNWRRRLPADVQHLFENPVARALLAAVRRERGGRRP